MHVQKPRPAAVVFLLLAGLFIAVRLWNLKTFCLDSDEVWSLTCARSTWSGLLQNVGYDIVHPPLFYMLLKIWVAIGGIGLLWVRLLPALLSFAALIPFYYLCRSLGLTLWQTNLGLVLLSLNTDQVFHSQYVRMYSLLFLLSVCSYLSFANWLSNRRPLIVLGVVNVLLVYSHYYGWAIIASEAICLLVAARKQIVAFLLQVAAVFACFVPWLFYAGHFALLRGGLKGNLGWIRRPHVYDLFRYYSNLAIPVESPYTSGALLFLGGVLVYVGLRKLWRAEALECRWRIPLLVAAAFLPVLASFATSQVFPESVWGNRHLVVAIVPFYILIALSLPFVPFHRMRAAAAVLFAVWFAMSMTNVFHPHPRLNYEVLAELMVAREHSAPPVPLLIPDRFLAFPLRFQLDQHAPGQWDVRTLKTLDSADGGHFWVAYHRDRWKGEPPAKILEQRGYRVGPAIWVKDDWQRVIAFPVWRNE